MAVITQFGTSILSAAEDATPAGASGAATALLTTWDKNKLTSAARVYQAESNSDITWTKILTILRSPPAVSFEEKKVLGTYITRRGRRGSYGILYPRGGYIPYRRRGAT